MGCCDALGFSYLPPLSQSELQDFQRRSVAALNSLSRAFGIPPERGDDPRAGVTMTPNGTLLYVSAFGRPRTISEDWDVVLHIPLGVFEAVLLIKNLAGMKKLQFRAVLNRDGTTIAEVEFDVEYGGIFPFNDVGVVRNVTIKSHDLMIQASCLEECIKRHAPKCAGVCIKDPTGWACILCAGGAIGCCLINCHC